MRCGTLEQSGEVSGKSREVDLGEDKNHTTTIHDVFVRLESIRRFLLTVLSFLVSCLDSNTHTSG